MFIECKLEINEEVQKGGVTVWGPFNFLYIYIKHNQNQFRIDWNIWVIMKMFKLNTAV